MINCDMPSAFLESEALYFSGNWFQGSKFFENLCNKVAIDHVTNFWRLKIISREIFSKNSSQTSKLSRVDR